MRIHHHSVGLALAFATVLSVASASAQVSLNNGQDDKALTRRSDVEKKRDAEIDSQYQAVMRRSEKSSATSADPWASVKQSAPPPAKR